MFDEFFEVFLADTEQAKRINYNVRYQVYCEEMGFEDKSNFSEQSESDQWDKNAVHFIVRNRISGQWIGAMRLIAHQQYELPITQHCNINQQISKSDFNHSVEISRLCILKEVRRRFTDGPPPNGLSENDGSSKLFIPNQRRLQRSIIFGLFRAGALYCKKNSIDNWYFLTTSALAKIISKENVELKLIGDCCQLNGDRFPFSLKVDEVLANPLWKKGFSADYVLYSELDYVALAA